MNAVARPLVRYHGGKWKLAPWIIGHFPRHVVYCEPFGGGASVLLQKDRVKAEVYNDLDGEIVNLFRVVRDRGHELARLIELTPFARDEFDGAFDPSPDPVEQARRTVLRSLAGFGSTMTARNNDGSLERTGFRCSSRRSGTTPAQDWRNYPGKLPALIERLRGVVIENRDAAECMRQHDSETTLHYVDPPYVHDTRGKKRSGRGYAHELQDGEHAALAEQLRALRGFVVVSGYRCDLYDELYRGWRRIDRNSMADGARPRVESLWLSPSVPAPGLF